MMSCSGSGAWLGFSCMGPVFQPCSSWRTALPLRRDNGSTLFCYFNYMSFLLMEFNFKWAQLDITRLFCSPDMTWFQRCFLIFICFTNVTHWDFEWMFSLETWHWGIVEYRLHIWSRPGFILWFVILRGKWIIPNISRHTQAVTFLSALLCSELLLRRDLSSFCLSGSAPHTVQTVTL